MRLFLLFATCSLFANPQGPQVFAGSANFSELGTELQIATNGRTILNWDSFSIASDEVTRFIQNGPVLNRVIGINPSHLLGRLEANGEIYLLNPQGVLISRDAVIQTAGFIASTLDLDNELFLAGGKLEFFGNSIASIVYEGTHNVVEEGGRFFLVSNDLTEVSGSISASEVHILGNKVHLTESAIIDAPGGKVLIGGDYKGQNPDVRNAQMTQIDAGATICVDGREGEDGGRVIVWADEGTLFQGAIFSRGFNGGLVEISSGNRMLFEGQTDLSSSGGKSGTLLIDPKFIRVIAAGVDPVLGFSLFTDIPAGTAMISGATVSVALAGGSVILQANTDISFNDTVMTGTANGLTLQAGRSIIFTDPMFAGVGTVMLSGGAFNATVNDAGASVGDRDVGDPQFLMNLGSSIMTSGGAVTINHGMFGGMNIGNVTFSSASIDAGTGSILIIGDGTMTAPTGIFTGSTITTGTGTTTLIGNGYANGVGLNRGVFIGGAITAVNGDISITGMGGGNVTGNTNYGIDYYGSVSSTGVGATAATITLTGTGGNGPDNNYGIFMQDGAILTSIDGDIFCVGTGTGTGTGGSNIGAILFGNVTATGDANIMITGQGGDGVNNNNIGLLIGNLFPVNSFFSTSGDIIINGTGAGSGGSLNHGILTQCPISSTGGQISLTGVGPVMADGYGMFVLRPITTPESITLIGTGGTNGHGVYASATGDLSCTGTGNFFASSLLGPVQFDRTVTTASGTMTILCINPSGLANINLYDNVTCGGDFIAAANNNIQTIATVTITGNGSMIVDELNGPAPGLGIFQNSGTIISLSNNFAIYAVTGPMEPAGLPVLPSQVVLGTLSPAIEVWDIAIPPIPLNAKYSTSYQAGGPYHGPGFGAVYTPGNGVFGSIVIWYKTLGILPPIPIPPFELPFSPLALIGINADASEKYFLRPFAPCPILPCIEGLCETEEICLPELYTAEE